MKNSSLDTMCSIYSWTHKNFRDASVVFSTTMFSSKWLGHLSKNNVSIMIEKQNFIICKLFPDRRSSLCILFFPGRRSGQWQCLFDDNRSRSRGYHFSPITTFVIAHVALILDRFVTVKGSCNFFPTHHSLSRYVGRVNLIYILLLPDSLLHCNNTSLIGNLEIKVWVVVQK